MEVTELVQLCKKALSKSGGQLPLTLTGRRNRPGSYAPFDRSVPSSPKGRVIGAAPDGNGIIAFFEAGEVLKYLVILGHIKEEDLPAAPDPAPLAVQAEPQRPKLILIKGGKA